MGFSIDLIERVELIFTIPAQVFLRQIFIKDKNRAIDIAKNDYTNFILWYDRFKLIQRRTRAAMV